MVLLRQDGAEVQEHWYDNPSTAQCTFIIALPIGSLLFIYILLRIIWKPKEPKFKLPTANVPTYGSAASATDSSSSSTATAAASNIPRFSDDVIHAGQVAGAYTADWTKTFDMAFLVSMVLFAMLLSVVTSYAKPELWTNGEFWIFMLPKLFAMMAVSCAGGLICRKFCTVDEKGYVMTTRSSVFKVNYTRKIQHFAAYFIPLALKPSASCNCTGPLELAWGDLVTMLGFLILIKPLRERFTFLMLQFNSLDRPEDRPHTLTWIIAGNIAPGFVLLVFFRWLFSHTSQQDLVFIIVFITGIGDGLAEPVGITWGKHKYSTRGCFSARKYTRSWEGSACVFLSGMIFPAIQYRSFDSFTQLWVSMLILPPVVAYAEATAPHTMDTPVLMTLAGLILYGVIQIF